jgi:phosphohistidine swiveling domain-containing protein
MATEFNKSKEVEQDLASALSANGIFQNEPIVLARNENSDLLPVSKRSSVEFFELLFATDGPLWSIYEKTGIGHKPVNAKHLNFVGGRMYFCRNVEKQFMFRAGLERRFALRNGAICEERDISLKSLLLLLGSPFSMFANSLDVSLLPMYVNEKAREFSVFKKESTDVFRKESQLSDAKALMNGALKAMEFSFVSSLAAAFKVRIEDKSVTGECEAERLFELYSKGDIEGAIQEFGFHSLSPYDISFPRIKENPSSIRFAAQPAPIDLYARWRENAKFMCSRYMCSMRSVYLQAGKETKLGDLVFHLTTGELEQAIKEPKKFFEIAMTRKKAFAECIKLELPGEIVFNLGEWGALGAIDAEIKGVPAGEQLEATGEAVLIDSEEDYIKDAKGKIIVSRTFSPSLTTLYKGAKGIISESGGVLAHSAIIAREMGLPCIVQTKNIREIKEGQTIVMDGRTGKIKVKF